MTENKTLSDEVSENDVDNFKAIYLILRHLEKAMDSDDASSPLPDQLSLGITQNRLLAIIRLLINAGYVGTVLGERIACGKVLQAKELRITLKGLEYLETSPLLKEYRGY